MIHQNRISGLEFDVAAFTNITHDHLDYHNTFDEYLKAKKFFFDCLSEDAFVYRIGHEKGNWFSSFGTSYRNPTLYELNGDSWTLPNPTLDPEEAIGYEIGYKRLTLFKYKFHK